MNHQLTAQRILSIDAFRGITILVMIFVNELAGVSGIPAWMKHVPADADAMTFVDAVFPAFLFIVGMSIPFAFQTRREKGDTFWALQLHILFRTMGLLILGVFMVNAEGGYNEQAMGMSIGLWSLLFYASVILVWNVYTFKKKWISYLFRAVGVGGLVFLAIVYRGGDDGRQTLQPQWWGILGLIGWAYVLSCVIYQLSRGKTVILLVAVAMCTGFYVFGKMTGATEGILTWCGTQKGHAIHTAIVLCGIVLSRIFFRPSSASRLPQRFIQAFVFATVLFIVGYLLRPYYTLSKIQATPTWALYSAAACCILFSFLYWLIDVKRINTWTYFFKPAASNPLLTYIVPFIIYAFMKYTGLSWPAVFHTGIAGMLWSVFYAIAIMAFVMLLNRWKIRLQL